MDSYGQDAPRAVTVERRTINTVCETVEVLHVGAASRASLLESCGVFPGWNMLKALKKQDQERIASGAAAVEAASFCQV